jgi:sulfate permease, SulP family
LKKLELPLFYANAGRFADEVRGLVGTDHLPPLVRWVLVDAGAITQVDYSAARLIQELQAELASRGVDLVFAHVQPELQADLDRHHLTEAIGRSRIFDRLHDALAYYHQLERQDGRARVD